MAEESKLKKVYGIDLGTTYSVIACVNDSGNPEVIPNAEGDRTTASAVLFEPGDESGKPNVVVGKVAKEQANTDPERFVDFVKPHMGTDWKKEIEGIVWTPQRISAEILKKLKQGVENNGDEVTDVVITCPAYFNDAQRRATEEAGQIAGLNVLAVINEPTAAALHYGLNQGGEEQTAIVYDLGGGTFDVTVVKISSGKIEVVCSDGNHQLGGRDWDKKLSLHLAERFAEENGVQADELLNDPETSTELRVSAEVLKLALTQRPKAVQKVNHAGASARIEVTRETFNALTKPLLDETEQKTQEMIDLARSKGVTQFDQFLLVGGSTKMPQVMEMVKEKFGSLVTNEPRQFDVDEAVAKGAARYGTIMATMELVNQWLAEHNQTIEEDKPPKPEVIQKIIDDLGPDVPTFVLQPEGGPALPPVIVNVAARSYGIRVLDKNGQPVVCNLIRKQDKVPAEMTKEFPVSEDNAAKLPLKIYENENLELVASLDESTDVGETEMELTPGLPKGSLIRITFKLDKNGMLAFEALDIKNNKNVTATFSPKDALTPEEIEAARKEQAELKMY